MYTPVKGICVHCGKEYLGNPRTKYCGYNCSHAARRSRIILICQECGKEFETQSWNSNAKFCNYSCKTKNQSSDLIEISCKNCDTLFKRKSHLVNRNSSGNNFCSKLCSDKYNTGTNHYEWKPDLYNNFIPKKRNAMKSQTQRSIIRRARKLNISVDELLKVEQEEQIKIDNGYRFCTHCKQWKLPNNTNHYCKECSKEVNKESYDPIKQRINNLKKYGINVEEYDDLLKKQNNRCYICNIHQKDLDRALSVDHCHKTGKVRGLLCGNCNRILGVINDDVEIAKRIVEYLILKN